jgi:hypothetical protein
MLFAVDVNATQQKPPVVYRPERSLFLFDFFLLSFVLIRHQNSSDF